MKNQQQKVIFKTLNLFMEICKFTNFCLDDPFNDDDVPNSAVDLLNKDKVSTKQKNKTKTKQKHFKEILIIIKI
jgi:hypothetical protein